MPIPMTHIRCFLRLIVMRFLPQRARSFWPTLSGLDAALCALASLLHKTQQFQKNAYHNDKHLISET
jgi:hypothetical protein